MQPPGIHVDSGLQPYFQVKLLLLQLLHLLLEHLRFHLHRFRSRRKASDLLSIALNL
jgi:hypothetical protein